ncbi:hypothetical protein EV360DRAFT_90676 [Lentinula raphanica]|nr:hypothetical protein EV360DRAFT_90676 [Lentinula raphanica]
MNSDFEPVVASVPVTSTSVLVPRGRVIAIMYSFKQASMAGPDLSHLSLGQIVPSDGLDEEVVLADREARAEEYIQGKAHLSNVRVQFHQDTRVQSRYIEPKKVGAPFEIEWQWQAVGERITSTIPGVQDHELGTMQSSGSPKDSQPRNWGAPRDVRVTVYKFMQIVIDPPHRTATEPGPAGAGSASEDSTPRGSIPLRIHDRVKRYFRNKYPGDYTYVKYDPDAKYGPANIEAPFRISYSLDGGVTMREEEIKKEYY